MTNRITQDQEAALRADLTAEASTPLPRGTWSTRRSHDVKGAYDIIVTYPDGVELCEGHILFAAECARVCRMRNALPSLLAELDALRKQKASSLITLDWAETRTRALGQSGMLGHFGAGNVLEMLGEIRKGLETE
jgi:hypothetical protein